MRHRFPDNPFVPPKFGTGLRLVVAEAPGELEAMEGEPLVGGSGKRFDALCRAAGISRDSLTIINTLACRPPLNVYPTDSAASSYISASEAEAAVSQCYRNHVLPVLHSRPWQRVDLLGDKALRTMSKSAPRDGIMNNRGFAVPVTDLPNSGLVGLPTLHPAYISRDQIWSKVLISDLSKSLQVAPEKYNAFPSLEDLQKFTATTFAFDIENDPKTLEISMVGLSSKEYTAICAPFRGAYIQELRRIFSSATTVIGQNSLQHDEPILGLHGVHFAQATHYDTMQIAGLLLPDLKHGLSFLGSVFLQKPRWKNKKDECEEIYNCVAPETRVLTADLRWKPLGHCQVGEKLIGFDEDLSSGTSYQESTIESMEVVEQPRYEVKTDRGTVIATGNHGWAVRLWNGKTGKKRRWITTDFLQKGDEILFFSTPWEEEVGADASWLAGLLDGEGCFSSRLHSRGKVSFAQKEGVVLDKALRILDALHIPYHKSEGHNGVRTIWLKGKSPRAALEIVGRLQPVRLVKNARASWENRAMGGSHIPQDVATVISITPLGDGPVVAIATTTKTLVTEGLCSHNCRDVDATFQIWQQFLPMLKKEKLLDLYLNVTVPLTRICKMMQDQGVRVEPGRVIQLREKFSAEVSRLDALLPERLRSFDTVVKKRERAPKGTKSPKTGKVLKYVSVDGYKRVSPWRSNDDVAVYLYDDLHLPKQLHIKTKEVTVDKLALERLSRKLKTKEFDLHPRRQEALAAIDTLQALKKVATLLQSFAKEQLISAGTVHTHFRPDGTASGRLSSTDPNLQNQPGSIRYLYVPRNPDWTMVEVDYSGIEARLTAYLAKDDDRLDKYLNIPNYSEHKHACEIFFDIPYADVKKDSDPDSPYIKAKKIVHGCNYGLGARKLAQMYNLDEREIKRLITLWKAAIPKTTLWQERTAKEAEQLGVLTTPFGRKRWFWTDSVYTESLSFLPQSTAADIIFRSMIGLYFDRVGLTEEQAQRVTPIVRPLPKPAVLLLQVHDSLLFECPKPMVDEVVATVRLVMEQGWPELSGFSIPIDVKTGESWGQMEGYVRGQ